MSEAHTYESSGVAAIEDRAGFRALLAQLGRSFAFRDGASGRSLIDFGGYASILDIGGPQALAISTDGVGTKAIVAQLVDRYDTVGIDCVAMNVNDVLCVGAEPISMVDYIAVEDASDRLLEELGKGLLEGARQARISIPGGEISQIKEIIRAERPGFGFDLAGTCVGLVEKDRIIAGQEVAPGQVIVGLASSGIHSNGLTLARAALGGGTLRPDGRPSGREPQGERMGSSDPSIPQGERDYGWLETRPEELAGRTVGEELLEPTRIYVEAVMPVLRERLPVTALAHITSGGFLNLTRVPVTVGFEITGLPEPPGIFELIRRSGPVSDEEMCRVYNMGIGFCVVCEPSAVSRVIEHAESAGVAAWEIGRVVAPTGGQSADASRKRPDGRPSGRVWLREQGLVGEGGVFVREDKR